MYEGVRVLGCVCVYEGVCGCVRVCGCGCECVRM